MTQTEYNTNTLIQDLDKRHNNILEISYGRHVITYGTYWIL